MAFADSQTRDELLAELAGSPPPRRVSAALRKKALRGAVPLLVLLLALVFAGVGLLAAYFVFPWNFYQDWQLRAADAGESQARVMAVTKTTMSEGGSKNTPGTPVMQYDFDFYTASGATVHAQCYTTGPRWDTGAVVMARYRPENPTVACLEGARRSESDLGGVITLLFPITGGVIAGWVIFSRRRALAVLANGQVAKALVTDLTPTNMKINQQPVYKVTLLCVDPPALEPLILRKYQPAVIALLQERMQSQLPVLVIYRPQKPKPVLLPETW